MTSSRATILGALLACVVLGGARLPAQNPTGLAGSWTLNRQASQLSQEVGFSASVLTARPNARTQPQTEEDAKRVRFLTDEVRLPPERLTITVTPAIVTITPDPGAARTIQTGLRDEVVKLGPVTAITNASWEAGQLTVVYKAETGRLLRYTYSVNQKPVQLLVDVEFVEGSRTGDKVRRVYEPAPPETTPASPASSTQGAPRLPAATSNALRGLGTPAGALPSAPTPAATAIDQRPDAALKGLTRLGVVLEGLGAEAAKCGLKQEVLEAAVAKRLTEAGLGVIRDSDEESYLYVNINTVTASAALCVSRYDVTVYSHAAAQLTHTASPVPVQVELLHKGGLAGGSPAAHGDAVLKSVLEYVDQFATRIRNANK
jgi:hypothetical protein